MDQMKKIALISMILLILLASVTSVFADQYGETYYQVLPTYPNEGPWSVPEAVSPGENLYTFALDFSAYWNSIPIQGRITFNQNINANETYTVYLDFNSDHTITISGNFGSQSFSYTSTSGFLIIPFNNMSEFQFNPTTNGFIEILNNEQLTGATNQYDPAFQAGYNTAVQTLNAGRQLIVTIFETPINILQRMLNFEILGVNILGIVTGLFSLAIVALIVKKVT